MFWNIFFNSLVLIVVILFVGWGIARLVATAAKRNATTTTKED